MPLHIPIFVNDLEILTVHIGRLDELYLGTQVSTYKVTDKEWPQTLYEGKPRRFTPNWDAGVEFTHKYDDGALVCVRKALQALEDRVD